MMVPASAGGAMKPPVRASGLGPGAVSARLAELEVEMGEFAVELLGHAGLQPRGADGAVDGGSVDSDNNNAKDFAARLFARPFKNTEIDPLRGGVKRKLERSVIFPASHYATPDDTMRAR